MLQVIFIIFSKTVFRIIVCILCISFSSCNLFYSLFYTNPQQCFAECISKKPYDVIIVPGFPHDSGKVSMILNHRIKWAYFLYKNGYTKNIIFSGSAVHSPYIEADVMRLFALQLGIKKENIFTETKAEHTTENLYYSYVMAKELGFKSIAFATEAAQASFMKPFKRKFKLDLDFLPVIDTLLQSNINLKPIDEKSVFIPDFIALKEREGILKSLRGTRGHKVKIAIRKAKKLHRQQNKPKSYDLK